MLRYLRVRNLAVIESVELDFEPGFTVLTGETGAGKSLLIEAVGLLLGGRASADLVRTGEAQASVEAVFEDADGGELVVRRDITSAGRSRAFINGELATTAVLRERVAGLVELHGQHEHQALLDPATHLPLLDAYAGLVPLRETVAAAWAVLASLRARCERAGMDARERAARLELVAFQLGEIERVSPRPGEDEELAVTRQVLASAERVRRLCDEVHDALYEGDPSVLGLLGGVRRRVAELAALEPAFSGHAAGTDEVRGQLEDLAQFARSYGQRIDASAERLQEVEERLAAIERLKRRYGPTLGDVLARRASLAAERALLEPGEDSAGDLRRQLDAAAERYLEAARRLSSARRAAAPRFARELEGLVGELAMTGARVEVRFAAPLDAETGTAAGLDVAELFISPNPGEDLRPLARIVSGGELSRVMLALKTLGARPGGGAPGARTFVFDEVDAGIGGAVADVVGARLQALGRGRQVLCITHLPQIAARGDVQYRILKTVRGGRTSTTVERVSEGGRVEEIARMIGGASAASPSVREGAKALLAAARGPAAAKVKGESESPRRGESERRRRARKA